MQSEIAGGFKGKKVLTSNRKPEFGQSEKLRRPKCLHYTTYFIQLKYIVIIAKINLIGKEGTAQY